MALNETVTQTNIQYFTDVLHQEAVKENSDTLDVTEIVRAKILKAQKSFQDVMDSERHVGDFLYLSLKICNPGRKETEKVLTLKPTPEALLYILAETCDKDAKITFNEFQVGSTISSEASWPLSLEEAEEMLENATLLEKVAPSENTSKSFYKNIKTLGRFGFNTQKSPSYTKVPKVKLYFKGQTKSLSIRIHYKNKNVTTIWVLKK